MGKDKKLSLLVIAFVVFLGCAFPHLADADTSFEVISQRKGYDPNIIVDADGTVHAVWVEHGIDVYEVVYAYKLQGGDWIEPEVVASMGNALCWGCVPALAIYEDNVHVLWSLCYDFSIQWWEAMYSQRDDVGNWNVPVNISNTIAPSFISDMKGDINGNLYAVWQDRSSGNNEVMFSKKPDSGEWEPSINISQTPDISDSPRLEIDNEGNLYVIWAEYYDDLNLWDIMFRYKPSSVDWFSTENLTNGPYDLNGVDIGFNNSGNPVVAWGIGNGFGHGFEIRYMISEGIWSPIETTMLTLGPLSGFVAQMPIRG